MKIINFMKNFNLRILIIIFFSDLKNIFLFFLYIFNNKN
jgi:hypothetical protein